MSESRPAPAAVDTETSEDGPSPLRAPSAGAGGEFEALGRASASRPSAGGLGGAAGGGGSAVQLTGSIDHHHYHHYDGESGESSQVREREGERERAVEI